jgi:hypothetical protein
MPPKKKKGGKRGKGKKPTLDLKGKKSVAAKLPPSSPLEDPLTDPWGKAFFKSQFGGKLSPAEEWDKLHGSNYLDPLTAILHRDAVLKHLTKGGVLLGASIESDCHLPLEDTGGASLTVVSADGTTQNGDTHRVQTETGHTVTTIVSSDSSSTEPNSKFAQRLVMASLDLTGFILSPKMGKNLVSLNLTDNRLKDAGMLGGCWLRDLNLAANQLSTIPNLLQFPKLLRLNLSHNPICDVSSASFDPVQLRCLIMQGCSLNIIKSSEVNRMLFFSKSRLPDSPFPALNV